MIEVKNLFKRFEGGEALSGINLKVYTGEICAVAGAGKTTLCDLISGAIEPDQGQILICGEDIVERPGLARQNLGYAPEKPSMYLDMTPRAGMKFIADARGIGSREAADLIDAAIKKFGLKDVADTKAGKLTAGVRKLVNMAQAAFTGVKVLVIDEPTAGMNPKEIVEMRELLKKLKKDHAIVLTSASITELCELADRVVMLKDGKIAAEGKPEELHRLSMNDGTLHLIIRGDESAVNEAVKSLKNAELTQLEAAEEGAFEAVLTAKNGEDLREAAFKAVCGKGLVLLGMAPGKKPLDELLKELVSERVTHAPEKEEQGDEGNL